MPTKPVVLAKKVTDRKHRIGVATRSQTNRLHSTNELARPAVSMNTTTSTGSQAVSQQVAFPSNPSISTSNPSTPPSTIGTTTAITTTTTTTTTCTSTATTTTTVLEDVHLLSRILSFVGTNQYRFVAAVCTDFKAVYHQLFPENTTTTYYNASSVGHAKICIEECPQMHPHGSTVLCNSAARHGSLSTLTYLQSKNFHWNQGTFHKAAEFGQRSILENLRIMGSQWDARTCALVAKSRNLSLMQWCRANGCPWDSRTCSTAAKNGDLVMLQWCRANGCPWNERT
jgi:hypothetical protein